VAWKVTSEGYTLMRPLVMDFRTDVRAQNTGDEYLFGPSILVAPVTEQGATSKHLYLPQTKWYDFWTGLALTGGQAVDAGAPLRRCRCLCALGQSSTGAGCGVCLREAADPIELRIYRGADGDFRCTKTRATTTATKKASMQQSGFTG